MNNMRFDGYGYPDMNVFDQVFLQSNNNMNPAINMNNQNMGNQNLAQPYEGYIRGNLFNNLYQQYKNYQPARLIPNNEQAELLLNVDQITFAAHELKLYLDIHPDDKNIIRLYNNYQKMANDAINAYEKKYGPLLAHTPSKEDMFSWEAYAWPWEREEL